MTIYSIKKKINAINIAIRHLQTLLHHYMVTRDCKKEEKIWKLMEKLMEKRLYLFHIYLFLRDKKPSMTIIHNLNS